MICAQPDFLFILRHSVFVEEKQLLIVLRLRHAVFAKAHVCTCFDHEINEIYVCMFHTCVCFIRALYIVAVCEYNTQYLCVSILPKFEINSSAMSATEAAAAIKYKSKPVQFSVQILVDCANYMTNINYDNCDGCLGVDPGQALQFIASYSIPLVSQTIHASVSFVSCILNELIKKPR